MSMKSIRISRQPPALDVLGLAASIFEEPLLDRVGDRQDLPRGGTVADDEVVGELAEAPQIQDDDVFRLLVQGGVDDLLQYGFQRGASSVYNRAAEYRRLRGPGQDHRPSLPPSGALDQARGNRKRRHLEREDPPARAEGGPVRPRERRHAPRHDVGPARAAPASGVVRADDRGEVELGEKRFVLAPRCDVGQCVGAAEENGRERRRSDRKLRSVSIVKWTPGRAISSVET